MSQGTSQPGDRSPAPDLRLRLLQEFVNTADLEAGIDDLSSVEAAHSWLANHGHRRMRRLTPTDYRRLLEFRDALRLLIAANNDAPLGARDRARLNKALSTVVLRPLVDAESKIRVSGGDGLDRFLADLVETIVQSTANRTWSRLKACRRDACRWVFWDASRNSASTWCTMALCGSREKMKAYRSRKKQHCR